MMISGTLHRNALPAGCSLNEYTIEEVLSVGGMGITYLAKDCHLDQRVVIKEYLPNDLAMRENDTVRPKSIQDEDLYRKGLEMFRQESRSLSNVNHPNIVRVLTCFSANGTDYRVMRYYDGLSLGGILRSQDLSEEEIKQHVLLPILDGLKQVHEAGFFHLNINPGNILICRSDEAPILLGFSNASSELAVLIGESFLAHSYRPFEQYHENGNQGAWSDIYALGAVAYRIVTGKRPHEASNRLKSDKMPSAVDAGGKQYGEKLLRAIDHALEVGEEDRPQTADEWQKEIMISVRG